MPLRKRGAGVAPRAPGNAVRGSTDNWPRITVRSAGQLRRGISPTHMRAMDARGGYTAERQYGVKIEARMSSVG
jgi:hypothetical protein